MKNDAPNNNPRLNTRRRFLAKGAGLAAMMAGLPKGWMGSAFASDAPETADLKFGMIALTDCSSIVVAHEKGLFRKYGIHSTVLKGPSWTAIRDSLGNGDIQATHMLFGMPIASTMGLGGGPNMKKIIPWLLNRNGQAITLTKELAGKVADDPHALKPLVDAAKAGGTPMTFAMTFPPGTHAMWMRYWLAAGGIHPGDAAGAGADISLITIPPPQMVANMKVGKMDGFCVGEPWNARSIADEIGFTAITTQAMWKDHPEKVCAFTAEFAEKNPKTVKAVLKALHEASVFIDGLGNRPEVAEVVSRPSYINCPKEIILGRLLGKYDHSDGTGEHEDKDYMRFFERGVNFPWKSHGVWWLSQFRRWGMVKEPPDYTTIVNRVHRPDIYREVAEEMGVSAPVADLKKEILFDGIEFDPEKPEEYAHSFSVNNIIS